ncbi:trypsin-like serine peptidase [Streptomyces sp. NPDC127074]|uniref:trypsin-like serine peptidase n=1 Tax=Streptomyces sp. NPDC127074 TaxID=3347130 RepID=UPI003659CB2F
MRGEVDVVGIGYAQAPHNFPISGRQHLPRPDDLGKGGEMVLPIGRSAAVVCGVIAAVALPQAAQASTGVPGQGDVVVRQLAATPAQEQAVRDYWTPARIAAMPTIPSQPVDKPLVNGPDGAAWTGGSGVSKTVGRLFFTDHGEDESCTATIVNSANRSTIVTAGHCVHTFNLIGKDPQWLAKPFFVPGFHDGAMPYGGFVPRLAVVNSNWVADDQNARNDEAFLVLNPGADGRAAQDAVGAAQRIGFDVPGGKPVEEFGYPRASKEDGHQGRPEFMGRRVAHCWGTAVQAAVLSSGPGESDPLPKGHWGVPCDMGGGSSGGPRLADFDVTSGQGTVVGVDTMSDQLDSTGGECVTGKPCLRYLVGPQFTNDTSRPLYDRAAGA